MVIVLLANGFEELEAITPVDVLRRNNIDVRTVSITSEKLVTGTHGIQIAADLLASDVPLDQVKMLILPGGMPGVKNLDASLLTQSFIDATLKNGGHLAAICAAPSIFGKHGMLTNIKATCFPGFEAEMHNAILTDAEVVTDGIFTTARDYRAATAFADELVKICDIMSIKPRDEETIDSPLNDTLPLPEPEVELTFEYDETPPFEATSTVFKKLFDFEIVEETKEETKKPAAVREKVDYSAYKLPSLDLLGLNEEADEDTSEIIENGNTIIETLAAFNVSAKVTEIERGPRITRYVIVPEKGVKVNSITNLFNDIALNLAKEGIRMEAPIPGRSAIGFEVPNNTPGIVRLRELLESDEFAGASSKSRFALGKDVSGNGVFGDISRLPHLIVAGATGMGKSVCINSMLTSLLYKMTPDELNLILIDPKKVEFRMYSGLPHLRVPVITEAAEAAGALFWACNEMERRYELLENTNTRNIEAYNLKVDEDPSIGEKLPKLLIVIDELADLMLQVRDPIEDLIMRIAQKARATGIHLIIGTQRPSVQVITGCIKANIPSRISLKVTSQVDSRTIFDMSGAEKLLNRGDMLYWPVDKTKPVRVQCAFVSDSEVENVVDFIKAQYPDHPYDAEVAEYIKSESQKLRTKRAPVEEDDEDDGGYLSDKCFLDAVELVIRAGKASTSLLQRKLSIGYGKAAKFIDAMEELGIVGEPNHQKPREVLITLDEWREKLGRIKL